MALQAYRYFTRFGVTQKPIYLPNIKRVCDSSPGIALKRIIVSGTIIHCTDKPLSSAIMPEGGNWKDLLKAAEEGDAAKARYHIAGGVDPNFQHPEYFTAPIHEAIKHGNLEIVQIPHLSPIQKTPSRLW